MKTLRNILVLYNKPENINDASDLDTQKCAFDVSVQLHQVGYQTEVMAVGLDEIEKIKNIKADLVFNLVEWTGKNIDKGTQVIKILEKMGTPFTGSGSKGFLLSSDKVWMKEEMIKNKIPTPGHKFPMIVKPAYEHCGIGISQNSIVYNDAELRIMNYELRKKFNQPVIAEEFIDGRELHVTVLERNGRPWVLPPAEVVFHKPGAVLSYEMKWVQDSLEYTQAHMEPAKLDKSLELRVERIAKKAYTKLGGRDYPRLDMRIRGEEVYVLEINNNPGLDFEEDSGMGVSARLAGFENYGQLVKHIVDNAYLRFTSHYDTNFV